MSEDVTKTEVVLVGGSKDGSVTDDVQGTSAINNIVLNDDKTGPEFIDLYMPAAVTDKENRPIYVHIGRYDADESKSYWDSLTADEKQALVDAANAAEEFVEEEKPEDEKPTEETATEEEAVATESVDENTEAGPKVVTEHATEEVTEVEPAEAVENTQEAAEEPTGPVVESEHAGASEEKPE